MNFVTSLFAFSIIILHHVNLELNILNNFDNQNVVRTKYSESINDKQTRQQQQQRLRNTQPVSPSRTTYFSTKPASSVNSRNQIKNAASSGIAPKTVRKNTASDNSNAAYKAAVTNALESELKTQKSQDLLNSNKANDLAPVKEIEEEPTRERSFSIDGLDIEASLSSRINGVQPKLIVDADGAEKKKDAFVTSEVKKMPDVASKEQELETSIEISHQELRNSQKEERLEHSSDVQESLMPLAEERAEASFHDDSSIRDGLPKDHSGLTLELPVAPVTSVDQDVLGILNSGNDLQLDINSTPPAKSTGNAGQVFEDTQDHLPATTSGSHSKRDGSQVVEQVVDNSTAGEESVAAVENSSLLVSDPPPSLVQPPFQSADESPNGIPGTAFIPGDKKSDSELRLVEELEEPSAMPSFREWKEKETERNRQLGAEQTLHSVSAPAKVKGNKKRVNYASVTCGAKIVGANPEAQNPSFVLIENKDQYMINPCKSKKVFTVELCEPLQVQAIEIGNLELFSSLPRSFDVHVSDRFPSKDWKILGRFHARDERTVQTFQVDDGFIFAKYIKLEMLSYYGSEHYCPLSIIRVFGTTLDEDDDADESESENLDVLDEEATMDTFTQDNPTNLFASATDTVLSLVKTVLNPSVEVAPKEEDAIVAASIDSESSVNSSDEKNKTLEPCVPEVLSGSSKDFANAVLEENAGLPYEPHVPEVTIDVSDQRSDDKADHSVGVPDASANLKQYKITLIEAARTSLKDIISTCIFCDDGRNAVCLFDRNSVCGYFRVMSFVDPQSCLSAWRNVRDTHTEASLKPEIGASSSGILEQVILPLTRESEITTSGFGDEGTDYSASKLDLESFEKHVPDRDSEKTREIKTEILKSAESESEIEVSLTDIKDSDVVTAKTFDENKAGGDDSHQTDKEQSQESVGGSIPASASKELPLVDKGRICSDCLPHKETMSQDESTGQALDHFETTGSVNTIPVQVNVADTALKSPGPEKSSTNIQSKASDQKGEPASTTKASTDRDEASNQGSNLKEIYAETSSRTESVKDYELDSIALDEVTFQKLSPRGKESAFIKLKNRIKLLEVNLNLTNRYLEELSQRYKRQMEDMHSSLNKTITKLSNMAKLAEERDVKQQDHIASLETTIENLTLVVSAVERSIESIHQQMIERHLYLMFLEALVFTGVIIFCLHRKPVRLVESTNDCQNIPSVRSVASSEAPQLNGSENIRRRSADSKPSRDFFSGTSNVWNSENKPFNGVEEVKNHLTKPASAPSSVPNDFSKKRKKKKLTHIRSLSPLVDRPKGSLLSLPSHSPATGLIFGTCKDSICHESLPKLGNKDLQFRCKRFSWDSSAYKPWKWNIFGSSQNNKSSSVIGGGGGGLTVKPDRSDVQEGNISNGITDHARHCFVNSCGGLFDNQSEQTFNDICLLDANDFQLQSKCLLKKASRGRPVAE